MSIRYGLLSLLLLSSLGFAQPKREFRAAWVATVVNLDWPTSRTASSTSQQADLVLLINQLADLGINAVFFQVRTECDALYASPYEPWSYWLTGTQGMMPLPFFDPLEVAVAEAHKRGMELHAWFNPYRAERSIGNYPLSGQHVVQQHPDWVITVGTLRILDPGKDAVRAHTLKVVMDVVRRYDVDGVHFDDYFYPYPPNEMTAGKPANDALDNATFAAEPRGFANKYDWRRDNINLLWRQLHDSIATVKPFVKIGMSPFGIWKSGVPAGISGMDAYNVIYADALAWLNDGSIDYLTPQLYWKIGGGQDYATLMPWWADQTKQRGRHFYPGQAPYHILDGLSSYNFGATEILQQIRLNRQPDRALGSVFFRARVGLLDNRGGLADSLRRDHYRYPALSPVMSWKEMVPPNAPTNLAFGPLGPGDPSVLQWNVPTAATDGDTAARYAVYRFREPWGLSTAPEDPMYLMAVTGERTFIPPTPDTGSTAYYAIAALDRNGNESPLSTLLEIAAPSAPVLATPANLADGQPRTVQLSWERTATATMYRVQVSTDPTFATNILHDLGNLLDTTVSVAVLTPEQQYWWRVRASNGGGLGPYSDARSFVTGFPTAPSLVLPAHAALDIPIPVRFSWLAVPGATSYHLQVAANSNFAPAVFDTAGVADTTLLVANLQAAKFYWWRVRSVNAVDSSVWSATFAFKSGQITAVDVASQLPRAMQLAQNFPNPFNPNTIIGFNLSKESYVTLRVYDLLGREVATLWNGLAQAGTWQVTFEGHGLPSGTYIYRLTTEGKTEAKRMQLVR